MKKFIDNLVGVAVLVLVAYLVATNLFNINIKNPFTGKSEVPESVVAEMVADTVEELNYNDNVDYTWEITHTPNRELHQDTLYLTLVFENESGSVTYQKVQTYQYYKENDIWEICEYGDANITDMQWNLEDMIDGKTFQEDSSSGSFTVTFSDLDMQTQTVTATYRYVYYDADDVYYGDGAWGNADYYITDLNGEQVNELNGTVRCDIEGEETSFFRIEEVIGYQYCVSDMYIVGYAQTADIVFQLIYRWPTEFSEPSVGFDTGW